MRPVIFAGEETGVFRVDLARHETVMSAIAYALHFHDRGRKHRGEWCVFAPSFGYAGSVYGNQPDPWKELRSVLASAKYTPMPVAHPEVFTYEVAELEQNFSCSKTSHLAKPIGTK
jgi:hypothetical protein